MATKVNKLASETAGKESIAVESFGRALATLPTTIADNAGYDSADLVSQLKAAHVHGKSTYGLDMNEGRIACMKELGIVESLAVKRRVVFAASEAAEMIMRVDNIIKAAPRKRGPDRRPC